MIGNVFGGSDVIVELVVVVVDGTGFRITAPPDGARDICCPLSDIKDPGRRVCDPITTPDDT